MFGVGSEASLSIGSADGGRFLDSILCLESLLGFRLRALDFVRLWSTGYLKTLSACMGGLARLGQLVSKLYLQLGLGLGLVQCLHLLNKK